MQFSLSYFSTSGAASACDKYQLLFEGARFADAASFAAIWIPERHFQEFGGAYPNPSVLGAALAAITRRTRIRAGSVVLPLHDPLRLVEEWSVVDNLSDGRIDLSFASGWHPADFVLCRGKYEDRKNILIQRFHAVRSLWSGGSALVTRPDGEEIEVSVYPRPVQDTLRPWITTSGNPATWQMAGRLGAGVLAALIGDSLPGLADKIKMYRAQLADNGHGVDAGHVTLMLHTFVGTSNEEVFAQVREPLQAYVRSYIRQKEDPSVKAKKVGGADIIDMSEQERDELASFAMQRYFKGNALLGTVESCIPVVDRLSAIGVDEIACLVDFGVAPELVIRNLNNLQKLQQHYA